MKFLCFTATAVIFGVTLLNGLAEADTLNSAPQVAQADSEAHANILQEVIVTAARKRSENVQTVPVAVTALNAELLTRNHVSNLSDLSSLAPNLRIQKQLATSDTVTVYLRGFGAFSNDPAVDPHVAMFVDGIYQPSISGTQFDMFDVSSVEVQGGPQGTLLGKNAPVGAIYLTTAPPTGDFSGVVEGDYGSYDHVGLRGKVNIPILQDSTGENILSSKVSLIYKEGGNWIHNLANDKYDIGGENAKSGRVALRFTPSPEFQWDLTGSLLLNRGPQQGARLTENVGPRLGTSSSVTQKELGLSGGGFGTGTPIVCSFYPGKQCPLTTYGTTDITFTDRVTADQGVVASTMSYNFDPVTLTSVTGYIDYRGISNQDDPGTPYSVLNAYGLRTRYDEESQELRLASRKGGGWDLDGKLDWVVGGYFSNFNYGYTQRIGVLNKVIGPDHLSANQYETGITQSDAAFLHLIYNFTDQWTGTFGVRQSWDKKYHSFQATGKKNYTSDIPEGFHNTSFEAGTAYQFDRNRMAYVRFAQGYESGGYSGFALGNLYEPELNDAYEVGFKSDWFNKRLRFNLDFFLNELSELQVASALPIPVSPFYLQQTRNAASATVEGMEMQVVVVPTENLTTHLNLGYLHTKYGQFNGTQCSNTAAAVDCSGNPFGLAPKWTAELGGDYVQDLPNDLGTAVFSLDAEYKSSLYTSDPPYPSGRQSGYALVNAGLKFQTPDEKYSVEFYGTNILDHHYRLAFTDPGGIAAWQVDGRPAEWGIRLTGKFGPFDQSPEVPASAPMLAPEAPPAAPTPAAQTPEAQRSFQVFFDFDKSDITGDASKVIAQAAEAIKAGHIATLHVVGHTDTVGSLGYNLKLSQRRAAAVQAQLVSNGVPSNEIVTSGIGKTDLLVPTPDQVREPQNRRAEIKFDQTGR